MPKPPTVKLIIPAHNEARAIAKVIQDVPPDIISEIIVVDNASTDETALVAANAGATVLAERQMGYGNACLKALSYLADLEPKPDIIVFIDGDYSDYPQEIPELIAPIVHKGMDIVIGSRELGIRERGSMTMPQVFGNWLATTLLKWIYGVNYTDLGPFRAIRYESLVAISMQDRNYGWTVEMQVKAAKNGLKYAEVPVNYKRRIGKSKVSGTVKGTFMAGYKIIWTIFKHIR